MYKTVVFLTSYTMVTGIFPRYWQHFQADDDIATVKRKTINILGSKKMRLHFFSKINWQRDISLDFRDKL